MTTWKALELYPPYMLRLRAKNGREALSDIDIAIAAGISINRVREIKFMTDWKAVTVGEMQAYILACGFDPTNPDDRAVAQDYEAKCRKRNSIPYRYLRSSPKWESELLPVLKVLQQKITQSSAA